MGNGVWGLRLGFRVRALVVRTFFWFGAYSLHAVDVSVRAVIIPGHRSQPTIRAMLTAAELLSVLKLSFFRPVFFSYTMVKL